MANSYRHEEKLRGQEIYPAIKQYSLELCGMWHRQLTSVVAWTGLYMDVGVDLNAKYAIMCRKAVLVLEVDEESIHSGLRQHFHLLFTLFDNFSGTSETIMHRPFNICHHSSPFKFLYNVANFLRSWSII